MTVQTVAQFLLSYVQTGEVNESLLKKMAEKPTVETEKPKKEPKVKAEKPKKEEPEEGEEGSKKRTQHSKVLDLETGTEIFRKVDGHEYVAIWDNEKKVMTIDGKSFNSPTPFAKWCSETHTGKSSAINGWMNCYIKRDGKDIKLNNIRG